MVLRTVPSGRRQPRLLPPLPSAICAEIRAAAEAVGARNVRVFGSVARGEETPESDVDLLVDFPPRNAGCSRC